ncbi:hypothetical protein L1049_023888 [Liquidambar formosana]|uniref:EF-hand domain-containing protein n=1 Tax=Liquidambar formosana TaxID=63359 RepID=A0AAP0RU85_LIQFO
MVREIDKDGDRLIDLNAFTELNTNGFNSHEMMENLKDIFAVYELDGNGSTSLDELHEVWSNLGDKWSLAECKRCSMRLMIMGSLISCIFQGLEQKQDIGRKLIYASLLFQSGNTKGTPPMSSW